MKENKHVFSSLFAGFSSIILFLSLFMSIKSYAVTPTNHSVSPKKQIVPLQKSSNSKANTNKNINTEALGPVTIIHQVLLDLSMAGFKHPTFQFIYFVPKNNKHSLASQLNSQENKFKNKSSKTKINIKSQGNNTAFIYFKNPNMKVSCERTVIPTIDSTLIAMKTVCSSSNITKPKKSEVKNPVKTIIDILKMLSDSELYSYLVKVGISSQSNKPSLADQLSRQQKFYGYPAYKPHEANDLVVTYNLEKEDKLVYCIRSNPEKNNKSEMTAICTINQDAGDIRQSRRW